MSLPLGYHDLIEALPERGCPVCRLVRQSVSSYLDGLLYEHVNSPPVHRDFRAGRGLCNTHMWQLPDYRGVSLGVAILDAAVLDEVLSIMGQMPAGSENSSALGRLRRSRAPGTGELADALEPNGPCLACQEAERVEQRTLRTLTQHFDLFEAAFAPSDGLCLPHLRALLRTPMPALTAARITRVQRDIWQRLKTELEEFQRKSDINHAGDPMGAEGDSWVRAIDAIAGTRGALHDKKRV